MEEATLPRAEAEKLARTGRFELRKKKSKAKRRNLGRRQTRRQPIDELSDKQLSRLGIGVSLQQRRRLIVANPGDYERDPEMDYYCHDLEW